MPAKRKYSDKIRLHHAKDAVNKIQSYIGTNKKISFKDDEVLQDACIRQLQIIGEACNTVTKAIQKSHPEIEWAQISGLRNIVVHEYFGVDVDIIWNIIKKDLPPLSKKLLKIIDSLPD